MNVFQNFSQNSFYFLLFGLSTTCLLKQVNSLSCLPCTGDCPEVHCSGNQVLDVCGCCMVCAKQEGEQCGGLFNMLGHCDEGLKCEKVSESGSPLQSQVPGVCQKILTSLPQQEECSKSMYFGCNVVNNRCVCGQEFACVSPFQYESQHMCRIQKNEDQNASDRCSNVKCSVKHSSTCPEDSVLIEGFVPPGECCPTPSRCECRPEFCNMRLCPPSTTKVLVTRGKGTAGSCCDVYICVPLDDDDTCATVRCPNLTTDSISCPTDSIAVPEISGACCPDSPNCLCNSCRYPTCPQGTKLQILKKGDGNPGSCCDLQICSDEPMQTGCMVNGTYLDDGEITLVDKCNLCTCTGSVSHCNKISCPPLSCEHVWMPPDSCCPVCDDPIPQELFPSPFPLCRDGPHVFFVGQNWTVDECTYCTCAEGGVTQCKAAYCHKPPVISTTLPCPDTSSCPLNSRTCPGGLMTDFNGCTVCRCFGDNQSCPSLAGCKKRCSRGFKVNTHGCRLCKCRAKKCRPLPKCRKQCPYGYKRNKNGCDKCQCRSCPPLDACTKECMDGLATNKYGCKVCRCKVSQNSMVSISVPRKRCFDLVSKRNFDDGETWSSGCYICVCRGGQIMCDLLRCPTPTCERPVFKKDSCCAICPDEDLQPRFIPQSLSCQMYDSRLATEGDTWDVNPCLSCTCHSGYLLCTSTQCPPVTCENPDYDNNTCCQVCPDFDVSLSGSVCIDENGTTHSSGSKFQKDSCTNCQCLDGNIKCYTQICEPTLPCPYSVVKRGQCCSQCLAEPSSSTYRLETSCTDKNGNVYESGSKFQMDSCTTCVCDDGDLKCSVEDCPAIFECSVIGVNEGECCPHCLDEEVVIKRACDVDGHVRKHAEEWNVTTSDCETCACVDGDVTCRKPLCLPISKTCIKRFLPKEACCQECMSTPGTPTTNYPVQQTPAALSKPSMIMIVALAAGFVIFLLIVGIFIKKKCQCKKGKYKLKKAANEDQKQPISHNQPLLSPNQVI